MPYAACLSGHYCCREINEISEDFALPSAEKGYEWDYNEFLRYFIVDGCLGAISYIYQRKATKGVLKKKKKSPRNQSKFNGCSHKMGLSIYYQKPGWTFVPPGVAFHFLQ